MRGEMTPKFKRILLKLSGEGLAGEDKNGIDMLLYQGERAFKLFTGEEMPIEIIKKKIQK